jgi:hypothetical protein
MSMPPDPPVLDDLETDVVEPPPALPTDVGPDVEED